MVFLILGIIFLKPILQNIKKLERAFWLSKVYDDFYQRVEKPEWRINVTTSCRMLKLADKPSCLGGEDPVPIAIGIGTGQSVIQPDYCLTASWRFESFSYSTIQKQCTALLLVFLVFFVLSFQLLLLANFYGIWEKGEKFCPSFSEENYPMGNVGDTLPIILGICRLLRFQSFSHKICPTKN